MIGITFLTLWLICYGLLASVVAVLLGILFYVSVTNQGAMVARVLRKVRDECDLTPIDRERFTRAINRVADSEEHDG